ncbi:hypothetical protein GCM10023081_46730 [Arthrobacter ginkgonis]|uniref:Rhodanese domain-containing protein n=1 Tax=Arthrobacter ginkgonis TaxID=1630594 RepID=A0ABP7DK84_9MICC
MALNVGELTAVLGLDAGPFDKGLSGAMDKLGNKGNWNKAAAGAGLAAGAALGAGLMSSVETDGAVRKMNAGLGLTGPDAEKAGNVAGELFSKGMGGSMEDVTTATGAVISSISGMREASEADVAAMTTKMMDLATAMEVDVARASQVAGQMIHSGLAKDGAEAADLLTVAMQKVPANIREDLLDATDEYGPFFSQLGISGETAMTMLVDSAQKGAFGIDKTGDALKEFTIRSTDMSKASGEAYKALGMDQEEMTKALLAGGDEGSAAFAKIIMGLQEMKDPAAQSQAALALFGTPLEDLNTGEIPQFIDQLANMDGGLGDVSGAAAAMGAELNGGTGSALLTFQRTAQSALSDVMADSLPYITPVLNMLTQFAPVIAPLALGLAGFAAAIWLVQGAIAAWNVIQLIMNATLWGFPVVWIIAAIIALIAAIWLIVANWDTISAWLVAAGAAFAAWWNGFWTAIGQWISDVWNGFIGWIQGVWSGFVGWLQGMGAAISGWWNGLWTAIGLFVRTAWNLILAVIKGVWSNITTAIRTAGENVKSFLTGIWNAIKTTVTTVWGSIVSWITGIPGKILSGLNALANLGKTVGEWFGKVKTAAETKFGEVVTFIGGIPGKILSGLGNLGTLLTDAGGQILQGFLDGLTAGFEKVKGFVGGIGEWIANNKGPKAYDLALLVPAGGWIMQGLRKGIADDMPALGKTLGDVSGLIAGGINPELTGATAYTLSATTSTGPGAGAASRTINYAPTLQYAGETPEQVLARDRARFNDMLTTANI